MTMAEPITPGALLRRIPSGTIDAERHLWGFGGLHGGLTLALLTLPWWSAEITYRVIR